MSEPGEPIVLSNEFATVEVGVDVQDGRRRLRVRSTVVAEADTFFDPLELELLAMIPHHRLRTMLAGLIEAPDHYLGEEPDEQ